MIVTKVLKTRNGVTLVETDTGEYAVGVLYKVGEPLNSFNPQIDFGSSKSLAVAEELWVNKSS